MHAFEYHRPSSSKDAIGLASKKEEARYLAGGQSLVQAMKLRLSSPSDLIDLSSLKELVGIKVTGGAVEIGAMTRHAGRHHRRPPGAPHGHHRRLAREQRSGGRLSRGRARPWRDHHHQQAQD